MKICDYHVHTNWSFDGKSSVEEVCRNAIINGVTEIALTDHYDIDGITAGYYPQYFADKAYDEIRAARAAFEGKLKILYGIELGQPHVLLKEAAAFLKAYNFDFVIGSIHNLANVPDFAFINFEKMPQELCDLLWVRYLDEYDEMLDFDGIHTAAHLTYPIRYMKRYGRELEFKNYHEKIVLIFEKLINKNICLEVNTSGLRQAMNDLMPSIDLLKLYKSIGGELITIGSDAHVARDAGSGIAETLTLLADLGFKYYTTIENKTFNMVKI